MELAGLVGELLGAWEQTHVHAMQYAQPVVQEPVVAEDSDYEMMGEPEKPEEIEIEIPDFEPADVVSRF